MENEFLVSLRGSTIIIMKRLPDYQELTKAQALNLAAYLMALAADNGEEQVTELYYRAIGS